MSPGAAFTRSCRICLLVALPLLLAVAARAQTVSTFVSGINQARGLAVDPLGRLYCSQRSPFSKIVRFDLPNNTPTTVTTGISDPLDMVFDDAGNLFVANFADGRIYKVTPLGVKSVFVDFPFSIAPLTRDAAGNMYVGDYLKQRILKVTPAADTSTYVPPFGDAGDHLIGLHMDADGTLYAALDRGYIYRITSGGSAPSLFCSRTTGIGGSFDRGPDLNFYVPDYTNNCIWMVTTSGTPSVFAGNNSLTAGYVEGPIGVARFNHPTDARTIGGRLYVADYQNGAIRVIDGISMVTPAANFTWGRLKSLYR